MSSNKIRTSTLSLAFVALLGCGLTACLSDDSDKDDEAAAGKGPENTGGSATAGTGGSSAGSAGKPATGGSGGGGPAGTACASSIKLTSAQAAIAGFDDYDCATDLSMWSFALGADSATGVFTGPFGYGDDAGGKPEAFEMVDGNESTYALSISDTESTEYGGGLGLWMSACLDASAFSGISFWVKGKAPTGKAKLSVLMQETTPTTPAMAESKKGTCSGTEEECIHPNAMFDVGDTWAEVKVPWTDFMPGSAAGNPVEVTGANVWQVQVDVGLEWVADDAGEYQPTPSDYSFAIDDITFY